MKNLTYFVLIMVPLILISSGCPRNRCHIDYKFQIPVSFTPAVDTFHVGDTATINIEFSDFVLDLNSSNKYQLIDFPFDMEFSLGKYDTVPFLNANFDEFFKFIPNRGVLKQAVLTDSSYANLIIFEYKEGKYYFNVDIVPLKRGIYGIGFFYLKPDKRIFSIDLDSECDEDYSLVFYLNDGDGDNYELRNLSPDPVIKNFVFEDYHNHGEYIFIVE